MASTQAAVITAIPGPDDQGGMIMPMVSLSGSVLKIQFQPPADAPVLASLETWAPGTTFDPGAAWYAALDPVGGAGELFNNQYGFTFMGSIPQGKALGLRLLSVSSPELQFFNYLNFQNRFEEVLGEPGAQVLWNGSMWHNYVTAPAHLAPGTYTARLEVFIANTTFTSGSGFADYSANALAATQDASYTPAQLQYTWVVAVPEPGTGLLLASGLGLLALGRRRSPR